MEALDRIPILGSVPALQTVFLPEPTNPTVLMTKSKVPYRRFAVRVADNGLDSFGLREGSYGVFREQRWPTNECSICLVRFGDDVSIRMFEGVQSTLVTLRVSGDRILPLELEPTGFSVVGVLDGVILGEFAQLEQPEEEFDWGC